MKIDKELLARHKAGEEVSMELSTYIMTNNNFHEIMLYVLEQLKNEPEKEEQPSQIVVTMEEYEKIMSLFRIKGYKMDETGKMVAETRGRKPKGVNITDEE
jgi:hypothetical protein